MQPSVSYSDTLGIARGGKDEGLEHLGIMAVALPGSLETMSRWAEFFVPPKDSPVPGMSPADFARLTMPTLVPAQSRSADS